MKKIITFGAAVLFSLSSLAQTTTQRAPIFDVHVHASKINPNFANDMSPWFLSNMPGADPNEPMPKFLSSDGAITLKAAKSDKEFQDELLATMKRLNMTIVVSGDASVIRAWKKASPTPERIIPSIGFSNDKGISVKAFEDSLKTGFYKVVGEIGLQYQGISPSDPSVDGYFEVAERLNVPVAIHMGTGGNGISSFHGKSPSA